VIDSVWVVSKGVVCPLGEAKYGPVFGGVEGPFLSVGGECIGGELVVVV
jgi:hypothetical protein